MTENDTNTTRRDTIKYGSTLATVGLAGCASGDSDEDADNSGSYSVTMSPVGEVSFDTVPAEVAAYDDQWADALVALGQANRVVAHGRPGNLITEFYDQLPGVSVDPDGWMKLSNNMSLETFYELDADVHHIDPYRAVATWDALDEEAVERLRTDIGPLFANRYSARRNYTGDESYQYYSIWELTDKFAELYQVEDRANELKTVYDEMVTEIQSQLPPKKERPRVAISVHYQGTFYAQPGPLGPGFARAHTRPLAPRDAFADYPEYSTVGATYDMETMAEVDPDVFIQALGIQFSDRIGAITNPDDGTVAAEVTAFETGRVYNGGTNYQGPLYTLFQTEMTAKQIYPELFGEWRGLGNTPGSERLFDRQRVADIVNGDI